MDEEKLASASTPASVFRSLLKELAYQFECQVQENWHLQEENKRLRFDSSTKLARKHEGDPSEDGITAEANSPILCEEPSGTHDDFAKIDFLHMPNNFTKFTQEANLAIPVWDRDLDSEADREQVKDRRIRKQNLVDWRRSSNQQPILHAKAIKRAATAELAEEAADTHDVKIECGENTEDSYTLPSDFQNDTKRVNIQDSRKDSNSSEAGFVQTRSNQSSHAVARNSRARVNEILDAQVMDAKVADGFPSWFHPTADNMPMAAVDSRRSHDPSELVKLHLSDEQQMTQRDPLMLTPLGRIRLSWDVCWTVALLVECFLTPIDLIFIASGAIPDWMIIISRVTLVVFCLDIILNFFTGYIQEGTEVLVRRKVILRYIQFWFWFDILVTIPWDEMFSGDEAASSSTARASRALRMQKLFKLLRLFRLSKTVKTVKHARERRNVNKLIQGPSSSTPDLLMAKLSEILKPLKVIGVPVQMLCWLLFLSHLQGALWAWLREDWEPTDNLDLAYDRYLESLWWTFSMFTFGNPPGPESGNAALWILDIFLLSERFTMLFMASVYVVFRALVMREDDASQSLRSHYAMEYLKKHDVSIKTQVQMLFSVNETGHKRKMLLHFERLLEDGIPLNLQKQVREELWALRLRSLGLLDIMYEWEPSVIYEMCQLVIEETYASRVVLFKEGEAGGSSYQILNGTLMVFNLAKDVIPPFTKDMWLGERALINPGLRRSATAISKMVSALMRVPAKEFHRILEEHFLLERFQEYCSAELWKGLCGRCGIFGDHFADECPSVVSTEATSKRSGPQLKRKLSRMFTSETEVESAGTKKMYSRDLKMYLAKHKLTRLSPILDRLGVVNLDLVIANMDSIVNEADKDPDLILSTEEQAVLTTEAIQEFQANLVRSTMSMIKEKVDSGQHYIFLSHYKAEAGTEAALMRAELENLISEDEGHPAKPLEAPIFLDSEDLSDLRELCNSVVKSHNLVIMLTKGILERPWCVVEIATAVANDTALVPVLISKPTMEAFQFPNEQFYKDMADGVILGEAGTETVLQEGFDMEFVCQAIKRVFKRIALPYSPHKSAAIRKAELRAILKQCIVRAIPSRASAMSTSTTSLSQRRGSNASVTPILKASINTRMI